MKRYSWIMMSSFLLFSTSNYAQDTMSIEQAVGSIEALNLTINTEAQKFSFASPKTSAKDSLLHAMQTENLQSILVTGSGQSHKYVQHNFFQDKNQQPLIADEHLINSRITNNKLEVPFKADGDELLTMHWQQKNNYQEANDIYSTWLLKPKKSTQFTEKTAALTSIRPLIPASLLIEGNDFPVRLYHQFSALEGHQLMAMHVNSKLQVKATSDSQGIAVINLSHAGEWVLMLKHENQDKEIKSTSYALLNFNVKGGDQ